MKKQNFKELLFEVTTFFSGFFLVCIGWVIFFFLQGGLPQFWSVVFQYNFIYSSSEINLIDRLSLFIKSTTPLTIIGSFKSFNTCL